MKLKAYSVRDSAVEAFMPPFWARAHGEAIRSFSNAVLDQQHNFSKNKDHYVLFYVGEFDDQSGVFVVIEPLRLHTALEVVVE